MCNGICCHVADIAPHNAGVQLPGGKTTGQLLSFFDSNQLSELDRPSDIFSKVPTLLEKAVPEVLWRDYAIAGCGVGLVPATKIDETAEVFSLSVEPRHPRVALGVGHDVLAKTSGV